MTQQPRIISNRGLTGALLTLVFGLAIASAMWLVTDRQEREIEHRDFQRQVRDVHTTVRLRVQSYVHIIRSLSSLFTSSETVTAGEWSHFVDGLDIHWRQSGIRSVAFTRYLRHDQMAAFEAENARIGEPGFVVHPAGDRAEYAPLTYIQPQPKENRALLGFDQFSEASRRTVLERARDSGTLMLSTRLQLAQEQGQPSTSPESVGLLLVQALYANDQDHSTLAARRQTIHGFVTVAFHLRAIVEDILGKEYQGKVTIDDTSPGEPEIHLLSFGDGTELDPRLTETLTLPVANRQWRLKFESPSALNRTLTTANVVLINGIIISLLLAGLVAVIVDAGFRAESRANQITAELQRSQYQLQSILDNSTAVMYMKSWPDLKYLMVNQRFEDIFALKKDSILGRDDSALQPEASREHLFHTDQNVIATRGTINTEERIRHADGQWHDYVSVKFPLLDDDGTPYALCGISIDITPQKRAEAALRDSEAHIRAVLNSALDGIITLNISGDIRSVNPAAERLFLYGGNELPGKNFRQLIPEPDKPGSPFLDGKIAPNSLAIGHIVELEGRRRDGSLFPMEMALSEMFLGDEHLYVAIIRDITERKQVERLKSEFISTVSHELRTPLTAIRGALGLVNAGTLGTLPERAKSLLALADKNSERLSQLINDILDIERIESGRMRFRKHPVDLVALVKASLAANAPLAHQYRVQLLYEGEAGPTEVFVDPERLTQVLDNLLSNAAKHSPAEDSIVVRVESRDGLVRLEVSDHGPGVPPEFYPRIFQKFAQADASDIRQKGGSGLGLAISKAIVEEHGGRIGFDSTPGQGACFFVELPKRIHSAAPSQAHVPRERIQLFEKSQELSANLKELLETNHYQVGISPSLESVRRDIVDYPCRAVLISLACAQDDIAGLLQALATMNTGLRPEAFLIAPMINGNSDALSTRFPGTMSLPLDGRRILQALRRLGHGDAALPRILHVEDEPDVVTVVSALLDGKAEIHHAANLAEARRRLAMNHYDLVLLDLHLPDGNAGELMDQIRDQQPRPSVLIFSCDDSEALIGEDIDAALIKSSHDHVELLTAIEELLGLHGVSESHG